MTSPDVGDLAVLLDPERLRKRKAWEIERARNTRRNPPSDSPDNDYAPILFPDAAGLRHAALVVAGAMVGAYPDRTDAVAHTREILEALGIPHILAHGGDGRIVRVQKGEVRFGEKEPAGFSVEDADARPPRRDPPKRNNRNKWPYA